MGIYVACIARLLITVEVHARNGYMFLVSIYALWPVQL